MTRANACWLVFQSILSRRIFDLINQKILINLIFRYPRAKIDWIICKNHVVKYEVSLISLIHRIKCYHLSYFFRLACIKKCIPVRNVQFERKTASASTKQAKLQGKHTLLVNGCMCLKSKHANNILPQYYVGIMGKTDLCIWIGHVVLEQEIANNYL